MSFLCGSAGKESVCNVRDLGSIPGLGRSPEEGKGYLLQYSGLENSIDCIGHGVAKSQSLYVLFKNLVVQESNGNKSTSIKIHTLNQRSAN